MTPRNRQPIRPSESTQKQEWQESQTLFLLTCYDVWSATPPRCCAAVFDTDGPA